MPKDGLFPQISHTDAMTVPRQLSAQASRISITNENPSADARQR
jgi:hypothetical protein